MDFYKRYGWLCLLLFFFTNFSVSSITPFVAAQSTSRHIPIREEVKEPIALGDVLREEKSVLYKDYEMAINSQGYPVLKRNGKVLMTFKSSKDGPYDSVRMGLFSMLGKNDKQLIYEIINGNICCDEYWIIDVSTGKPRIIYSSVHYGLNDALVLRKVSF